MGSLGRALPSCTDELDDDIDVVEVVVSVDDRGGTIMVAGLSRKPYPRSVLIRLDPREDLLRLPPRPVERFKPVAPAVDACAYNPADGTGRKVGVEGREAGVDMELVVLAEVILAPDI